MSFHLVTSAGQRKKNLSPHEESNLRPLDSALRCFTTEPQRFYYEVHMTRVLHTVRISNVVMFVDRNKHLWNSYCYIRRFCPDVPVQTFLSRRFPETINVFVLSMLSRSLLAFAHSVTSDTDVFCKSWSFAVSS